MLWRPIRLPTSPYYLAGAVRGGGMPRIPGRRRFSGKKSGGPGKQRRRDAPPPKPRQASDKTVLKTDFTDDVQ